LFLFVINQDYEIHNESYPWKSAKDVAIDITLPNWLIPKAAVSLAPEGVTPAKITAKSGNGQTKVMIDTLEVGQLIVLCNDPGAEVKYRSAYSKIMEFENKTF